MSLTKNQFQFIINSDVEEMVHFLHEEQNIPLFEAFDIVYNSRIYEKLTNAKTGLYLQSADYIYSFLCEELSQKEKKTLSN